MAKMRWTKPVKSSSSSARRSIAVVFAKNVQATGSVGYQPRKLGSSCSQCDSQACELGLLILELVHLSHEREWDLTFGSTSSTERSLLINPLTTTKGQKLGDFRDKMNGLKTTGALIAFAYSYYCSDGI